MHITVQDILNYISTRTDVQVIGRPGEPSQTLVARLMDHLYPTHLWTVRGHILVGISSATVRETIITLPPDVLLIHRLFENIDKGVILKGDL